MRARRAFRRFFKKSKPFLNKRIIYIKDNKQIRAQEDQFKREIFKISQRQIEKSEEGINLAVQKQVVSENVIEFG